MPLTPFHNEAVEKSLFIPHRAVDQSKDQGQLTAIHPIFCM
jgi:hypothetical protein